MWHCKVLLWHLIVQNYKTQLSHNGWIVIYIILLSLQCDIIVIYFFLLNVREKNILEGSEFYAILNEERVCAISSDKY